MRKKVISIVTPVYNEQDGLQECYETIKALFEGPLSAYEREHIFCDNCSTDAGTVPQLRALAAKDPNVKVILNRRNHGVLRNTYNGVMSSTGDAVCLFMPADLQDPPSLLPDFVRKWEEGYEVVYGVRSQRLEPWLMKQTRFMFYRLLSGISYIDYPPDVGDYQLVDRKVIEAYRELYEPQPFVRMMPFEMGFRAVAVPYTWQPRKHGKSRLRLHHLLDMALNGFVSFSNLPLRLALYVGLTLAFFSILYAVGMAVWKVFNWNSVIEGYTVLTVGIYLLGGVQLIFLGIIGEYVLTILNHVRKRRIVYERERLNFGHDRPEDGDIERRSSAPAALARERIGRSAPPQEGDGRLQSHQEIG